MAGDETEMIISPLYKAGAIVIAVLLVTNLVTYRLWRNEVYAYAKFKSAVRAQSEALEAEAKRRAEASDRATRDAVDGWSAAVDYWKSRAGRIVTVRVPVGLCDPQIVRPVPGPAEGTRPTTEELGPRTEITIAQCEERVNNAVLDAAQVEHLRKWVSDQRKASQKK